MDFHIGLTLGAFGSSTPRALAINLEFQKNKKKILPLQQGYENTSLLVIRIMITSDLHLTTVLCLEDAPK